MQLTRATHAVHVIKKLDLAAMAEYDRPVGAGALVGLDTTRPVDVAGVAKEVRGHFGHDQLAGKRVPWTR